MRELKTFSQRCENVGRRNNTVSMTPQEIFEYKQRWMPGYSVRLHSDLRSQAKDYCKIQLMAHQWKYHEYTDVYEDTFYFEHRIDAQSFEAHWDKKFVNAGIV